MQLQAARILEPRTEPRWLAAGAVFCALIASCGGSDASGSGAPPGGSGGGPAADSGPGGAGGSGSGGGPAGGTSGSSGNAGTGGGGTGGAPASCREVTPGFTEMVIEGACAAAFALDADDHAHFFVIQGSDAAGTATGQHLTNASGSFVSTPIGETAGRIRSVSLAIDSTGTVHAAYDKITGSTVGYASNAGGAWKVETISDAPLGGAGTQLALDPNGVPNVAFKRNSYNDLYLGVPGTDAWQVTLVTELGAGGIDFLIEKDGSRHIAFGADANTVAVASEVASSWTVTTVGTGRSGSLARPGAGAPLHVSFLVPETTTSPVQLRHAIETSPGIWGESVLIDEAPRWDLTGPRSVVTSDGRLHVVYSMVTSIGSGCGLQVATLHPGGTAFTVRRVATYGLDPLVALDKNDKLHLAYCSSGRLVYLKED